jgi:myo-inositol-1(or 4)-monophosphatase
MTPPKEELQHRLAFAAANIMPCAKLALHWFGKDTYKADHKADGTPVTIADQTIETELRNRIANDFPDDGILGEEFPDKDGNNHYQWVIDPIDGTISFVQGIPLFGTMLACLYDGVPVLGAIAMPCIDELVYAANGLGCFHKVCEDDPKPARVSSVNQLSDALVNTTALTYFNTPELRALYDQIDQASKYTRGLPDCYGFVLLATGRVDAVIEPSVSLWDIASVPPLIHEAGGISTDLAGKDTVHTKSIVAATPGVHAQLMQLMNR